MGPIGENLRVERSLYVSAGIFRDVMRLYFLILNLPEFGSDVLTFLYYMRLNVRQLATEVSCIFEVAFVVRGVLYGVVSLVIVVALFVVIM